jgi:copper transport protein
MSRSRRLVLLFTLLAGAGTLAPAAGAHALLERSDPSDGTRLGRAPGELHLWFTEDVSTRFSTVRVVDGNGQSVGPVALTGGGRAVVADLPELGKGSYAVYWRVLSEDDGHATGGSLAFGVGSAATLSSAAERSAGQSLFGVDALLRWLDFSLLAGLVGALIIGALILPRARGADVARASAAAGARLMRAGIWCAFLAAGVGIARLTYQVIELQGRGVVSRLDAAGDLILGTRWGWNWLAREAALLAVAGLLLSLCSRAFPLALQARWRWMAAGLGVVVVAAGHALTSHASSLEPASVTAVAADAAHVLSAGAWLGSVAAFVVALWPTGALGRSDAHALARACRGPFAECMALSVGLVFATGFYSAGREVVSVDGLLTTRYGHVLLVKIGIVLAAGALGLANFLLLRRLARSSGRIGRFATAPTTILAELVAAAGVFLAAGVLASSVPARGAEFAAPLPARVASRTVSSGDLLFTVSSTPTRAGATNTFSVLAASSRRPPPAPITSLTLELARGSLSTTVPMTHIGEGRYFGSVVLREPGKWRVSVVARRAGGRIVARTSWPLGRPDPARPVTYSTRSLAPILDAAAALTLGLVLLGAVWILAGRPRPRPGRHAASTAQEIGT